MKIIEEVLGRKEKQTNLKRKEKDIKKEINNLNTEKIIKEVKDNE
tara:strand:- start:913 stop:1047 length:135 start_codon:yes stop_codon:yes gene_type:complete